MGKFELKSDIRKDFVPDTVTFHMSLHFSKNCPKSELKKDMFHEVDSIKRAIQGLHVEDCSVRYSRFSISESEPENGRFFSKGVESEGSLFLSVSVRFKELGIDSEVLTNIVTILNNVEADIVHTSYYTELSSRNDKIVDMRSELARKCYEEAKSIVSSLNSSIEGIDSICYNSSGALLMAGIQNQDNISSNNSYFSDSLDRTIELDEDDDFSDEDYERSFSEGIVENIMVSKVSLSDSITVVFLVK